MALLLRNNTGGSRIFFHDGRNKNAYGPILFLDRSFDFAHRIRRFYLTRGGRAELPAEVRFFWNCMAEDECNHLAILGRSAGLLDLIESPLQGSKKTLAE